MRILIVDDELVSREKLRKIMDPFGQCIMAENGEDALRVAISQNPPDLILLDIIMPGMDGFEVCTKLKANRKTSNIPIIFISARSGDDEARGLGLGAVDYITKPFSPSIVKARVRTHLELNKHRNRLKDLVDERTVELQKATKEMQAEIAEKKHAEEALRENEFKYRTLFEAAEDAIFLARVVDQDLRFDEFNANALKMFRFKREDLIELTPFDISPARQPDGRPSNERALEKIRATIRDRPQHFYWKHRRSDGTLFDAEVTLNRIILRKRPYIQGIVRDITERKQAEEDLKHQKKCLESLIEYSSLAIVTLDEAHNIISCNRDFERLFGFKKSEIIERNLDEVIGGRKYIEDAISYTKKTFMGKAIHGAGKRQRKNREYIDVEFFGVPIIIEGKLIGAYGIYQDISERKRVDEALRASEEKYRTILKSIEDGYFEVDIAGNLIFFNDSLCEILGYPADELVGMNNRQYTNEGDARKLYQTFNKVYTTGNPDKGFDWEIIRKDGTKRVVEASVSLRSDAEGTSVGFRGIVRDISEKRRLETQLRQVQRMESIGTLAGGIAHNFNNLLMGIMGYVSLMLLESDPGDSNYKRLKNIEKQVKSGSKLTGQLLGYAREGSYEVRPISLNQLIIETSDTFGMTRKEITVHRELSEGLLGIKADQGQIEQVLLNLYVNAADAMPGGGDLFLKTMNVADKDMAGKPYKVKPGNYVLLTVRDTGVGMDRETRERIFEPFFTTKDLASGTGLGMASVYGIIKGHGGYIDVDSRKGKGATFRIYLPTGERDSKEKKVSSDPLVKGRGTILLVDDEEMVLNVGEQMLKNLGFEVLLAEDGQKAVDLYRKHQDRIDMVLLDMVMPVMGGGETFDRLKGINANVRILLSSGYSIEGEAEEILKRGCDAFIQKPFNLEKLSQEIKEILELE